MKPFLLACCLLLLALPVISLAPPLALSLQLPQYSFFKGEEFVASGECVLPVTIVGMRNQKEVFSGSLPCVSGSYSFREPLSFLVPSGEITVFASSGESARLEKKALIKPTRESAFLTVSILSPTERSLARTEAVAISVSVFDAGNPVSSAVVKTWNVQNEPFFLEGTENGVFSGTIQVPFDAPLAEWELVVVAESENESGRIGGEQSLPLSIGLAPVLIRLDSPAQTTLPALENILFRVQAVYADGSFLQGGTVELRIGSEKTLALEEKGNGFFEASYSFASEDRGLQVVSIQATDSAGNGGNQTKELFVSDSVQSQFFSWGPVFIVLLFLVALMVWLVVPKIRGKKSLVFLHKRKTEIEQELASLQQQYFEQNAISNEAFSKKSFALNKELEEISKKLKTP